MNDHQEAVSQTATVSKICDAVLALYTRFSAVRAEALRNYNYVSNRQLNPKVIEDLHAENRPALIFNILQPLILYLAGTLASNKQAMKASPLRYGDELLAELHTVLVSDYAVEGCDGYEEIAKAAIDAIIGKVGWLNMHWSTREDPEGRPIIESFDPFMMMWDPDGRKEDQSDWRYQCPSGMYGAEEIIGIFAQDLSPEMMLKVRNEADRLEGAFRKLGQPVGWLDRVFSTARDIWETVPGISHATESRTGLQSLFFDGRNGLYRVNEWHERRSVMRRWIYNPQTRQKQELPQASPSMKPEDDAAMIQAQVAQYPGAMLQQIPQEEMWVTVACPTLLPDNVLLEKPYAVQGKGYQHKPIFCYPFHPNLLETSSVVDALISPQDSYNQRRMTMLEYIMDTVNPKIDAPQDSIDPKYINDWKSKERGVIRFFKVIGGLKPEPRIPVVDKNALAAFSEEDRDLVQKISGISPNSQGYKESSNEPASLYAQRVRQGQVMMSFLNSHVLRTMKGSFRYLDGMIQQFMTTPRKVRLLSEPPKNMPGVEKISQGEQDYYWRSVNWPTLRGLLNDTRQGEYDFKPDFTQLGETAKQMKFLEASEFIKTIPPQFVKWASYIKLWDSPAADELAEYAEQMQQQSDAQRQQQVEAQRGAQALQQAGGEAKLLASTGAAQNSLDPSMQPQEATQ